MKILKLYYAPLDLSIQQVCTEFFTEEKIKSIWKKRYGKLFERCTIVVENDKEHELATKYVRYKKKKPSGINQVISAINKFGGKCSFPASST